MLFPYDQYRIGQREFIERVYDSISKKKGLIVHAPTGLGKSISVIAPILTYILENKDKNLCLWFLTPRHSQHKIVVDTLKEIKERFNVDFEIIDLIGKRWMCMHGNLGNMKNNEFNEYCKSLILNDQCIFYSEIKKNNKISIKAKELLGKLKGKILDVEQFKEYCSDSGLCSFEMACLKRVNIVVADYYHLLSEDIRDALFTRMEQDLSRCIIVFDEAHNLADRARGLLSQELNSYFFDLCINELEANEDSVKGHILREIKDSFDDFVRNKLSLEVSEIVVKREDFIKLITDVIGYDQLVDDLIDFSKRLLEEGRDSYCNSFIEFLTFWKIEEEEGFIRLIKRNFENSKVYNSLVYRCLDPSFVLKPIGEGCYSFVAMSGTLKPGEMYRDLWAVDAQILEFENPFPKENRLNIIVPSVSTKFTQRNGEMYNKLSGVIAGIVNKVPGNSAVFFPSYYLLEKIYDEAIDLIEGKSVFCEVQGMNKREKEELLNTFKGASSLGGVLFGVSSGSMGEGVDYIGDYLKCVIIVGLPLAKPDLEIRKLIDYYDFKYGRGWDYGYSLPAVIKIMQNAGRCIRSEKDRGVILYLDERYLWDSYRRCFNEEFKISKNPFALIKEFFNK